MLSRWRKRKEPVDTLAMNLRGMPAHECICGCNVMWARVVFHENSIAMWFLDVKCAECGSLLTAPTPVDNEGV